MKLLMVIPVFLPCIETDLTLNLNDVHEVGVVVVLNRIYSISLERFPDSL